MASTQQLGKEIPFELLFDIVTHVVADYIDSVILGPLRLRSLDIALHINYVASSNFTSSISDHFQPMIAEVLAEDPAQSVPNPIIPLLSVSSCIREVALCILSKTLGVPLTAAGERLTR